MLKVQNVYNNQYEEVKLSIAQNVELKVAGYTSLGKRSYPGWKGEAEFFLVRCKRHKTFFIDYAHGYNGRVNCPDCDKMNCAFCNFVENIFPEGGEDIDERVIMAHMEKVHGMTQ